MAYRWNRKSIENETIINGREQDIAINDWIDNINNNIDRENLKESIITEPVVQQGALVKIFTKNNVSVDESVCGKDLIFNAAVANHPRGNEIYGLRYKDSVNLRSGGMWIRAKNAALDGMDLEEGMLTVEYNTKTFIPKYRTFNIKGGTAPVAPKYVQWQIRYNGSIVHESGPQFMGWNNVNLSATFPVAQGNGEISIHYRLNPFIEDSASSVVLYFFGGEIVAINRRK
mgnify:CR=1 FL=1